MTRKQDDTQPSVVPRIKPLVGASGVHIHDPIEDAAAMLETDESVSPSPADVDRFVYPVDTAAAFQATTLSTPHPKSVWIRDANGDVVAEVTPQDEAQSFPEAAYFIEFSSFAMKLYGHIESGFHVIPRTDEMEFLFDPDTTVRLGARSRHTQPARTISTTRDPEGVMEAISLFGNGMKTWSPERTFPTLRGHPPLVEYGSTAPYESGHTPPETGITLQVPAECKWVYPTAPLGYWFGATVEAGDPSLVVNGNAYPLGKPAGYQAASRRQAFENHLRDLLQYSFMFETAMRQTYERDPPPKAPVENAGLGLDLEDLSAQPVGDRLEAYLETVSFASLSEQLDPPEWQLTANVEPTLARGSILPFLARDLAVVRAMPASRLEELKAEGGTGTSPFEETSSSANASSGETMTRLSHDASTSGETERIIRSLPESRSLSQAWAGAGFAEGAATISTASYLKRLENLAAESSHISVDVVVNDDEMTEETAVTGEYGARSQLDFGVTLHQKLSQAELATRLEEGAEFIHYVGHATEDGFECTDGYLDAASLDRVEADMFVLNACSSYEQGQQLVEKGAIAGIVTLNEVISSAATTIGRRLAQLLNYGFPIGAATDLIRETKLLAQQYSVIGDSNATLAQPSGGTTSVDTLEIGDDGQLKVTETAYATWNLDVGSIFFSSYSDKRATLPSHHGPIPVDDGELAESLERWTFPIVADGGFYWSDDITVDVLRDRLCSE